MAAGRSRPFSARRLGGKRVRGGSWKGRSACRTGTVMAAARAGVPAWLLRHVSVFLLSQLLVL